MEESTSGPRGVSPGGGGGAEADERRSGRARDAGGVAVDGSWTGGAADGEDGPGIAPEGESDGA